MEYRKWLCHDVEAHDLELGDHVYVWVAGGFHTHHGIVTHILEEPSQHTVAIEDRIIVTHFSPVDSMSDPFQGLANLFKGGSLSMVYDVPLRDFVGTQAKWGGLKRARYDVPSSEYWMKRAGTCYQQRADPAVVVLCRAHMLSDDHNRMEQTYSMKTALTSNCEHIAFWCKTGIWRSSQIDNLPTQVIIGVPHVMGGMVCKMITSTSKFLDESLPAIPLPEAIAGPKETSPSSEAREIEIRMRIDAERLAFLSDAEEREREEQAALEEDRVERQRLMLDAERFYEDSVDPDRDSVKSGELVSSIAANSLETERSEPYDEAYNVTDCQSDASVESCQSHPVSGDDPGDLKEYELL